MQYKLKKDLPFAKAGSIVDEVQHRKGAPFSPSLIRVGDLRCQLNANLTDIFDWIEEVKPREYWIGLNDGLLTQECIADNKEAFDFKKSFTEIIKVREVLED